MKIKRKSPLTGEVNVRDIDVTDEEYLAWESGKMIQDAMPRATADDREFILSGYTPEDWKEIFG